MFGPFRCSRQGVSGPFLLAFLVVLATTLASVATAHINFDERNEFLLKEIREGHVGPGIFGFELGSIPKAVALDAEVGSDLGTRGDRRGHGGSGLDGDGDGGGGFDDDDGRSYSRELTMTYGNGSRYRCIFKHLVEAGSREDVEKREADRERAARRKKQAQEAKRKKQEEEEKQKKEPLSAQEAAAKAKNRAEAAAALEAKRKKQQQEEEEAYFGDALTIRCVCRRWRVESGVDGSAQGCRLEFFSWRNCVGYMQ